jgi:hypothetical protein
MDDPNLSDRDPAARGASDSAQQADCDRLQTITEACSVMKDEMASQAQHIIGNEQMGKPPTITQACSAMKGQITTEAQQILANQQPSVKSQTFTQACDSIKSDMVQTARQIIPQDTAISPQGVATSTGGDTPARFASDDADDHFYLQPIEQAQKAMLEAQWFEQ